MNFHLVYWWVAYNFAFACNDFHHYVRRYTKGGRPLPIICVIDSHDNYSTISQSSARRSVWDATQGTRISSDPFISRNGLYGYFSLSIIFNRASRIHIPFPFHPLRASLFPAFNSRNASLKSMLFTSLRYD